MSEYILRRLTAPLPELAGRAFDPDACAALRSLDRADIAFYPWDESGYRPEARAYAGWDDAGLQVLLCAKEETIQARETRVGGPVCVDSCLEFFLMPFPDADDRYLNIEVNPAGTAHIGLGAGRAPRRVWSELPEGLALSTSRHAGGWWAVRYALPMAFLREIYGRTLAPGATMRGNFYTCDEQLHPHFGAWNPVVTPRPDFHRPEYFGALRLEAAR